MSDIAIGVSNLNLNTTPVLNKPIYLIYLNEGKGKLFFITQDKPDIQNNFIIAKGMFCAESEANIIANFQSLFASEKKENIVEIYFPWHRIHQIKNLVFKTNIKK